MSLLKVCGVKAISLDINCADKLLASGNSDATHLYIYMLRNGGEIDLSSAEKDLKLPAARIGEAASLLASLNLISGEAQPQPAEFTAAEITGCLQNDTTFHSIADEAERLLNRKLTENDLRRLLEIYRDYSFDPETIVLLISHCCREYSEKNGAGKYPSMTIVTKEAKIWQENNISNSDDAEEYLRRRAELRSQIGVIAKSIGISGRRIAPTERAFIEKWIDAGFAVETVEKAYDITVTRTGKLAWKYMDAILANWNQKTASDSASEINTISFPEETHEQRAVRMLQEWKKKRS